MANHFSVLSFGSRGAGSTGKSDSDIWIEQVDKLPDFERGSILVNNNTPSVASIKSLFERTTDDWLLFAGHFLYGNGSEGYLTNHPHTRPTRAVRFDADALTILSPAREEKDFDDYDSDVLGPMKSKPKVVFWAGCNTNWPHQQIRRFWKLFGPHTLIGWINKTGWQLTKVMYTDAPADKPKTFFQRLTEKGQLTPVNIKDAWLETARAIYWGNPPPDKPGPPYEERFSVVIPEERGAKTVPWEYYLKKRAGSTGYEMASRNPLVRRPHEIERNQTTGSR